MKPLTPAQRQKRHRATGRAVSVVITCPDAMDALWRIQDSGAIGVKAALEIALRAWRDGQGQNYGR